jgi:hypothetical protein
MRISMGDFSPGTKETRMHDATAPSVANDPAQWNLAIDQVVNQLFGEEVRAGVIQHPLDISDVWKNSFSVSTNHKVSAAKFTARHPKFRAVRLLDNGRHVVPRTVSHSTRQICSTLMRRALRRQPSTSPASEDQRSDELGGRIGITVFVGFVGSGSENKAAGSIHIRIETIDYFLRRYRDAVAKHKEIERRIEVQLVNYESQLRSPAAEISPDACTDLTQRRQT